MKNYIKAIILLSSCLFLIACSDENNSSSDAEKDHVWKEQTDAINKAKEVESMVMDAAENTRNVIEEQNQ